ncbi:hypothetical protein Tco_0934363 [Tanacetum coccineum]
MQSCEPPPKKAQIGVGGCSRAVKGNLVFRLETQANANDFVEEAQAIERWLFLEKVEGRTSDGAYNTALYSSYKQYCRDAVLSHTTACAVVIRYLMIGVFNLAGVVGSSSAYEDHKMRFGNDESHEHHMFTRLS